MMENDPYSTPSQGLFAHDSTMSRTLIDNSQAVGYQSPSNTMVISSSGYKVSAAVDRSHSTRLASSFSYIDSPSVGQVRSDIGLRSSISDTSSPSLECRQAGECQTSDHVRYVPTPIPSFAASRRTHLPSLFSSNGSSVGRTRSGREFKPFSSHIASPQQRPKPYNDLGYVKSASPQHVDISYLESPSLSSPSVTYSLAKPYTPHTYTTSHSTMIHEEEPSIEPRTQECEGLHEENYMIQTSDVSDEECNPPVAYAATPARTGPAAFSSSLAHDADVHHENLDKFKQPKVNSSPCTNVSNKNVSNEIVNLEEQIKMLSVKVSELKCKQKTVYEPETNYIQSEYSSFNQDIRNKCNKEQKEIGKPFEYNEPFVTKQSVKPKSYKVMPAFANESHNLHYDQKSSANYFADSHASKMADKYNPYDNVKLTHPLSAHNIFSQADIPHRHFGGNLNRYHQKSHENIDNVLWHPLNQKEAISDVMNNSFEYCLNAKSSIDDQFRLENRKSYTHPLHFDQGGPSYHSTNFPPSAYTHYEPEENLEFNRRDRHVMTTNYVPLNNNTLPGLSSFPRELSRKFGGSPLEFQSWKLRVSQEIIDNKWKPNIAAEYILSQTTGAVKQLVLQIANVEFNASWELVIEIFTEIKNQFAQNHMIRQAIHEEITKHPMVTENMESLNSFIRLCRKIDLHKGVCGDLIGFDMAEGTAILRSKLPRSVQDDYGRKWRMYEERFNAAPPLSFLIEVVKNYRSKALSSRYAPISNDNDNRGMDATSSGKAGTRKIHVIESQDKDHVSQKDSGAYEIQQPVTARVSKQPQVNEDASRDRRGSEERCAWHEILGHDITQCYGFLKLNVSERRDFIMKKGLCLNCLNMGHVASRCPHKEVCNTCSRKHHILLHYERMDSKKSQDARVGCTKVCGDALSSAFCAKVVLVDLALASDPGNSIRVYAIIDEQSDTTVVDERVADHFGGSFPTREITTRFVTKKAVFRHEAKVLPELRVKGVMSKYSETLKGALSYPSVADNKHQVATPEIVQRFAHTARYSKYFPALDDCAEIMVLIGIDNIHIHRSDRLTKVAPYVHRTPLGYALVGKVCEDEKDNLASILRLQASETTLEEKEFPVIKGEFCRVPLKGDFDVLEKCIDDEDEGFSAADRVFLHMMKKGEIVAPTRELTYPLPIIKEYGLPDNRDSVYRRTIGTLRNIQKNPEKLESVLKIMEKDIKAGHVEQLRLEKRETGSDWYLPPFVVTHKRKGTPRLVFDAAAEFEGVSLNKLLLQGPDLLCNLRGVLLKFREKKIAITADIQGMFLNFKVTDVHRRFLRFFWFQDNMPSKKLVPFQINTHAFGLKSSPAVANFALRSIADGITSSEDPVRKTLLENFYVDDLLSSTDTVEEAQQILQGISSRLSEHNIVLHKFASSDIDALRGHPNESLSVGMKNLPEEQGEQSALGVRWDTDKDHLSLTLNLPKREFTKRGILSVIGSLYDPIGFISPVILGGRLFQREVLPRKEDTSNEALQLDWDDPLPTNLLYRWREWCSSLQGLENLVIPRCLYPTNTSPKKQWLCGFSDASENAMGYVIYLLTQDTDEVLHLGFVCGSSRVAPKGCTTIPRLELNAALLMARAVVSVRKSLSRDICSCLYFTDSKITLGYIQSETRRFTKYIERRAFGIRDLTCAEDWYYVATDNNPADLATRPVNPQQLADSIWFSGPRFLLDGGWLDNRPAKKLPEAVQLNHRILKTNSNVTSDIAGEIFSRTNSLTKASGIARRALSLLHQVDLARQRLGFRLAPRNPLPSLYCGRTLLSRLSQEAIFSDEFTTLKRGHAVSCKSSIYKLSPWIDEEGIIRMEGRLSQSGLPWSVANPVILPKSSNLAKAVVLHFHHDCHHQGSTITRSSISRGGFHIVGSSKFVKSIIHRCVMCNRLRGRAQEQKMSDLPKSRVTISPPFTNVGVDLFGPFHIKDTIATRRHNSTTKMWGCVFTCLSSRAVHFEALSSLDASSFLNAFSRFCAIRGQPKLMKSDRGGNFVSASKKLGGIDSDIVSMRLEKINVKWEFNPPHASHFGGVWERIIGSARRVMEGMLAELHQKTLDMETFVTLLAEASRIINFTPLWITACDTDEPSPLCPADLLLISRCNDEQDIQQTNERDLLAYGPRRHRRATYLVSVFWQRWEADYLVTLNQRSKWFRQLDVEEGDIILVIDDNTPRSFWPLAIISTVHPSSDGKIRKVTLKVGSSPSKYMERPLSKTISILPKRYQVDLTNDNVLPLT